ncbi:MAG: photosystem reaction center subunit H [Oscillatoriales cyanobacterium RM2_1_1]|nr:photosystem reaction center subunit H [Oscillatoriales cyanobacterium SM2_3_0]NJO45235.1 photosystem reaction center subunit H [Oscillatoriales cyanobacterium RM2_1_1]
MTATAEENILNSYDVLNQLVLDAQTIEEVGKVSSIQLDPQTHQVLGITCKSGLLGRKKQFLPWSQIQTFGKDSVLVQSQTLEVEPPEKTASLIGHQLWTDAGNQAGKIVGYRFDPQTGRIAVYLFVSNGWQGITDGVYQFPTSAIASIGPKRLLAADSVIKASEQHAPGVTQKMAQAADFLKEDYKQTQQDMSGLLKGGQNLAGQVKQKAGEVAEQAKLKAEELGEQAKVKAEQFQEKAGEVTEQAKLKAIQLPDEAEAMADQAEQTGSFESQG